MHGTMQRKRLRSRYGCLVCRQRRKKCDEQKPKCAHCTRLRLVCKWDDDEISHLTDDSTIEQIIPLQSDQVITSHMIPVSRKLRVADHDGIKRDSIELPSGIIEVMSTRYVPTQTTNTAETRHWLITGIFRGWNHVPEKIKSSEPWSKTILFDHQLQRSGQGLVARLAISFSGFAMYQYLAAVDSHSENVMLRLPAWYLPKQSSAGEDPHCLTNYPVWPGVRERFATEPERYYNDRFVNALIGHGTRFVWPYSAASAITISTSTGLACFTDEFILRSNNLRSYAATSDFLNKYPEFRSAMSQLEPSPTFYRPDSAEYLEALYWSILRERSVRSRSIEGSSASGSVSDTATEVRLQQMVSSSSEEEFSSGSSPSERSAGLDSDHGG